MSESRARRRRALLTRAVGRWTGGRRILAASIVLAVLATAWFAINFVHPQHPLILLSVPPPLSLLLTTVASWRTAGVPHLRGPTRRFWRQFAIVVVLVALGTVSQAYDTFGGPTISQHIGPVTLGCYGSGIMVLIWAMYRLPLGDSTPGGRLRIALDAGTVVLATAVFMWHFQTKPLLEHGADQQSSIVGSGVTMILALVAVFALAKVIMSASAYVDLGSLQLLAVAVAVGALGDIPQTYIRDKPYLLCPQVTIPAIAICAILAAERQRRTADGNLRGPGRPVRRRPYSVLPYVAVAAVDALLVVLAGTGRHDDLAAVSIAAVALTALVIMRQLTAFQENGRLLARLDHNATHDALTQLPNRAFFEQRLAESLASDARPGQVCLALIDLNDFKLVNDTLGHGVGDALLVTVAPRLVASVRPCDTVARLGGDEFVVIFDDVRPAQADELVRAMVENLAEPVRAEGHELQVRASVGLATGGPGDEASELLRRADVAMYAAKSASKTSRTSHYMHYTDDLDDGAADLTTLATELAAAIDQDQLHVLYQPIVALDSGDLLGVEALVRWRHPTRGPLPPAEFIPLAERTGLIIPLGRWVIEQGCRQVAAWTAEYGHAPATLQVNVSAVQLREPSFPEQVAALIAETGLPAGQLILEITETAVAELPAFGETVHALRRLGVGIAFDDFGTAQSTLSLLENSPVDQLKLDKSFVQREITGQRTMTAAVIHLARALGLHVVAEGVETQEQADHLRALGYTAAQGFHFAEPMPPADVGALLARPADVAA